MAQKRRLFFTLDECSAKDNIMQGDLVLQFSSVEFCYGENYNFVISPSWVSWLQHLFTRNHAIFVASVVRMVRCILDDHTKEDKFPVEYSIEYTWPCITSDYEKNSVSLGFFRFRWRNAAEIFFAEANITTNKCDSLFLPASRVCNVPFFRALWEKCASARSIFVHLSPAFFHRVVLNLDTPWFIARLFARTG